MKFKMYAKELREVRLFRIIVLQNQIKYLQVGVGCWRVLLRPLVTLWIFKTNKTEVVVFVLYGTLEPTEGRLDAVLQNTIKILDF